jgi:hypothetical protein
MNDLFPLSIDVLIFLKVRSSAEQIRNLEHRIQDLKNDLEMNHVAQNQLKLAVHHYKMEKLAYQKFVSELLFALSQKGIVRVIDGQGTEASLSGA